MRVGVLVTSISNFGQKGFYNAQEIGLAKALDNLFDEVNVYKLVSIEQEYRSEKINGCNNASICFIPSKNFGINGLINTAFLDKTLDGLIYFSDTQFSVHKVYRWAKKYNVKFFPYIGVIESHSTNKIKKIVVDTMFKRNLKVYKNSHCLVKTPTVERDLRQLDVRNITLTPVGLDLSLMNQEYEHADCNLLKRKYGYKNSDKVLLFIGRLTVEKQPVPMIDIFLKLYKEDNNYRLLIVGTGELKEKVISRINEYKISEQVQLIDNIPNKDIWELYRIAYCFLNLNQKEIFGMAILEAMYYECKVIAWRAPGPELIIEDGVSGYLIDDDEQLMRRVKIGKVIDKDAHERVISAFTWRTMAQSLYEIMNM